MMIDYNKLNNRQEKLSFQNIIKFRIVLLIVFNLVLNDLSAVQIHQISKKDTNTYTPSQLAFLQEIKSYPSDSSFEFDITNYKFNVLPDISRFTHITAFKLMGNNLTELKIKAKNLRNTKTIDARDNIILKFKLGKAPKLKSVFLDNNPISKIPIRLIRDRNLNAIYIDNKNITKIPYWFKYRKNIKELNIKHANFKLNKKTVRRLKNIETLQIAYSDIDSLPKEIVNLKKLKKLNFAFNKIHSLPSNFNKLEKLEILILYSNKFTEIPNICFKMNNLKHLDFYYNSIGYIPMNIPLDTKIEELYLSFNNISIIPHSITNIKTLKKLYVHHNSIEELPQFISELHNLEILDVGFNQLIKIPNLLANKKLQEIDFQENSITTFPFELLRLPELKFLFLSNNPFEMTQKEATKLKTSTEVLEKKGLKIILFSRQ